MNVDEAKQVLAGVLGTYRERSYDALRAIIDDTEVVEVTGPSGAEYQVEIMFIFDDSARQTIRVMGSIDDGGLRAFFPVTSSLIVRRDET